MSPAAIIAKKRDFCELTEAEIRFMVEGLASGSIPDYQISAWAMAILCRGMTDLETFYLTDAMLDSGQRLERTSQRPRLDKHSTGGLGDKVSLILAPLLAVLEVEVPMLSGRGLGITGGTLDKLEAYPGYRCDLDQAQIAKQLEDIGCVICGTTPEIVPADRKLYALRDVTGTVPSIALITASIMSKKLAGSLDALVMDVKFGSGAFMPTLGAARELASSLEATGLRSGLAVRAVLSDMNQPLGRMVGNAVEANEAVQVLQGGGPPDVRALTLHLAAELLVAAKRFPDRQTAIETLESALVDGRAHARFQQLIRAQGGSYMDRLPVAAEYVLESPESGWLAEVNGQMVGQAVIELGGGRNRLGDQLDHAVGLEFLAKIGDRIERRQPFIRIFSRTHQAAEQAQETLLAACSLRPEPLPALQLIHSSAEDTGPPNVSPGTA